MGRFFSFLFAIVGLSATIFVAYLEYSCRFKGKYCEKSLFSETPETLESLLAEQKKVTARQEEISRKLDSMSKGDNGSSNPDEDTNFAVPTVEARKSQTVEGIFVRLHQCTRVHTAVDCRFDIKNTLPNEALITLYVDDSGGRDIIAYLPDGNRSFASWATWGEQRKTGLLQMRLPSMIPANVVVRFDNVTLNVSEFVLIQLPFSRDDKAEFRNVKIETGLSMTTEQADAQQR